MPVVRPPKLKAIRALPIVLRHHRAASHALNEHLENTRGIGMRDRCFRAVSIATQTSHLLFHLHRILSKSLELLTHGQSRRLADLATALVVRVVDLRRTVKLATICGIG